MRVIDQEVTGQDMYVLAQKFFDRMNTLRADGEFNRTFPAGQLQKVAEDAAYGKYVAVLRYMAANVRLLFTARPATLKAIHEQMVRIHGNAADLKSEQFKKLIRPVFGYYDSFRAGARDLIKDWFMELKVATCPFCNRIPLDEILKPGIGENKYLLDIDHFFPVSEYPYFELSYFNLIPSCSSCNSRIKGAIQLDIAKHMHPYVDDMDSILYFDVPIRTIEQFTATKGIVELNVLDHEEASPENVIRAKRTFKFFELPSLYANHRDKAKWLVQRAFSHDRIWLEQNLKSFGGALYASKEDLVEATFENSLRSRDTHKRPLSKLTKDVLRDFEVTKFLGS